MLFVALRFRCRCIGIEKDGELLEFARAEARRLGVERLCRFISKDFSELPRTWLDDVRATHVYVFDGVFQARTWNVLFDSIASTKRGLVGASTSRHCVYWPAALQKCGNVIPAVSVVGGKSSFSFVLWTKPRK